jgi:hypothetical protein
MLKRPIYVYSSQAVKELCKLWLRTFVLSGQQMHWKWPKLRGSEEEGLRREIEDSTGETGKRRALTSLLTSHC